MDHDFADLLNSYMATSARAIGLNTQFMYLPNCMIISFIVSTSNSTRKEQYIQTVVSTSLVPLGHLNPPHTLTGYIKDNTTQTTKVSIVTAPQGFDLGRMRVAHEVYLHVVHKVINAEEGLDRLEDIMVRGPKFNAWVRVLMCTPFPTSLPQSTLLSTCNEWLTARIDGLPCACVAPFGFQGRLIDLPLAFVMGTLLGLLHLILAPANQLFSNVFEIVAVILMAFLHICSVLSVAARCSASRL